MISRTAFILSTLALGALATQEIQAGCTKCQKAKRVKVVRNTRRNGRLVRKVATVQVCTSGTCPLVRK